MNACNSERAPDPEAWLELDKHERILLVENHHRPARIKLPNRKAHAVFHVIVENQIAMNLEPVVRATARLMNKGLARHDAVHAIGSVVAEHLFELAQTKPDDDAATSQARYHAAVERLGASGWRGDRT